MQAISLYSPPPPSFLCFVCCTDERTIQAYWKNVQPSNFLFVFLLVCSFSQCMYFFKSGSCTGDIGHKIIQGGKYIRDEQWSGRVFQRQAN